MSFQTTPTGYEKTILLDLQGAWSIFREAVADTVYIVLNDLKKSDD
jgi:hypothetical protein